MIRQLCSNLLLLVGVQQQVLDSNYIVEAANFLLLSNNRRVMQTINTRAQNFWMGAVIGALLAAGVWFLIGIW